MPTVHILSSIFDLVPADGVGRWREWTALVNSIGGRPQVDDGFWAVIL